MTYKAVGFILLVTGIGLALVASVYDYTAVLSVLGMALLTLGRMYWSPKEIVA